MLNNKIYNPLYFVSAILCKNFILGCSISIHRCYSILLLCLIYKQTPYISPEKCKASDALLPLPQSTILPPLFIIFTIASETPPTISIRPLLFSSPYFTLMLFIILCLIMLIFYNSIDAKLIKLIVSSFPYEFYQP